MSDDVFNRETTNERLGTNRRGTEIQQSIEKTLPISPPLPILSDVVKRTEGKLLSEFVEFITWAKSLRPGWDVGKLNAREQKAAEQAFAGLQRTEQFALSKERIEKLEDLRAPMDGTALSNAERERIMNGDFEL